MIPARYRRRLRMDPVERALDDGEAATRDLAHIRRSTWASDAAHARQMAADRAFVELTEPIRHAQWAANVAEKSRGEMFSVSMVPG